MYSIKMNATTLDYEIRENGKLVHSEKTKPLAKKWVAERTTETVIIHKTDNPAAEAKETIPAATPVEPATIESKEDKKPETPATPAPKKVGSTLFDDIKQATEEDGKGNGQFKNEDDNDDDDDDDDDDKGKDDPLTKLAKNAADTDDPDDNLNKKQSAKLTAMLIVSGCEIVLCFLCQWISGDWSKEGEKKYNLSDPKKKALQIPLQKILEMRTKKINPVWSLVAAILLSFAPMIILAFADRRKKTEDKEKAAKENMAAQEEAQRKFDRYKAEFLEQQKFEAAKNAGDQEFMRRAMEEAAQEKEELAKIKFKTQNDKGGKGSFGKQYAEVKKFGTEKKRGRGRPRKAA